MDARLLRTRNAALETWLIRLLPNHINLLWLICPIEKRVVAAVLLDPPVALAIDRWGRFGVLIGDTDVMALATLSPLF